MSYKQTSVITVQEHRRPLLELLGRALRRAVRYPAATISGIAITWFAGWALESVSSLVGHSLAFDAVFGAVTGTAVWLMLVALMVMREERLSHLPKLVRTGLLIMSVIGVAVSVPVVLLMTLLPGWTPIEGVRQWVSSGPVLLVVAAPMLMVSWPIMSRSGTGFIETAVFVWRHVEGRHYIWWVVSLVVGAIGLTVAKLPIVSVIVPVLLAHLAATFHSDMLETKKRALQPDLE
jgi:hypothetical protein